MNIAQNANNKEQWEKFAQSEDLFYIDTNAKNEPDFWRRGDENFTKYILPILHKYAVGRGTAIDFGCGIGRHTLPLSHYFKLVLGVDIVRHMLVQAQILANKRNISNVRFIENYEFFLNNDPVDFIYCALVFQHIDDGDYILEVLKQMARRLVGIAYVHFDTRPHDALYRLRNYLPNFILPRSFQAGMRRIRRDSSEVKNLLQAAGFSIIEEQHPHSQFNFFVLRRA